MAVTTIELAGPASAPISAQAGRVIDCLAAQAVFGCAAKSATRAAEVMVGLDSEAMSLATAAAELDLEDRIASSAGEARRISKWVSATLSD